MKKLFTLKKILLLFLLTSGIKGISQVTIAKWTFDAVTTTNTGTTPTISTGSATADAGSQTTGSSFTASHASAATVWSNPAGNGSAKSFSANNWGVNDYYQFQVSTTGYTDISVIFDQTGSATGPKDFKVQYSTNGTTFSDFTGNTYVVPLNAGAVYSWTATTPQPASTLTFNLSSTTSINNNATVYFRIVNTSTVANNNGAVAATGTNRVDNFTVNGTVSAAPLYYRTKASGNWNDVNTWESSSDNSTWVAATATPDFNSNTITIQGTHTVTVTADVTIDQTSVIGILAINPNVVLTVNDGPGTDLSIISLSGVQLKSTAAGSGSIGNSAGSISGNVLVERYISNRRAWRLLGTPYSTSTSIYSSWMDGGRTLGAATAGNGTQITTYSGDPNATNFDAQKSASSIRIYSADNFNSDAVHTPNTTSNISANQAYFLFVRGDRTVDRTAVGAASSATTLRSYGTVYSGNVTKGLTGTSFSLIPNPYPSNLDFDAVKAIAANSSITTFYVWDASLGSVGQYRTVSISGSAPNFTYTSTPSGGSANANNSWRYIESGTAFFVPGTRTVDFTEATKTSGIPPSSMLRVTSGNETQLLVNLFTVNADNSSTLTDGVRELFDNSYSAAIDSYDAEKITGFDINLGISSNNKVLAVERRPLPGVNDIIALKIWNTAPGNYFFEVQPDNFSSSLPAYLKDNYLGTYAALDLSAVTKINFSISTDAPSAAANRFTIVFAKPAAVNVPPSILVYPNPIQNGEVTLRFTDMPSGVYTARLLNSVGQTVISKTINHSGANSTERIGVSKIKGSFILEVIKPDHSKVTNKVIIN